MPEALFALILVGWGLISLYRALYLHYIVECDDKLEYHWKEYFSKTSQRIQFFHMILGPLVAIVIIVYLFL